MAETIYCPSTIRCDSSKKGDNACAPVPLDKNFAYYQNPTKVSPIPDGVNYFYFLAVEVISEFDMECLYYSGIGTAYKYKKYCRNNQGRVECFDLYNYSVPTVKLRKKNYDAQGKTSRVYPDINNKNVPNPNDGWNSTIFNPKGYAVLFCRPGIYATSPRDPSECPIEKITQ